MKFITAFLVASALLFSLLYGLILAVDPYNKFGYNLFGFETKAVDFARENKFNQIEHAKKQYEAFIMGSSSAHRYATKDLNRLSGFVSYNYSTQSATVEDYISMTRHIFTKFQPKLLLISMDFEVMNKNTKTDDMFYSSPLKDYLKEVPAEELTTSLFNNSYLTLEAIGDSLMVIWVNLFGKANHAYLDDGDHVEEPTPKELKVRQFSYPDYEFDQNRIAYLKTIKKMADEKGMRVIVFTSPLSLEHVEKIQGNPGLKEKHEAFKQLMVSIFGELYDFQNAGNAPFNSTRYFRDSNHPTHEFSRMVLERIFGQADPQNPEFGKLLK